MKALLIISFVLVSLASCNTPKADELKLPVVNAYRVRISSYKLGETDWLLTKVVHGEAICQCNNFYYSKGDSIRYIQTVRDTVKIDHTYISLSVYK